MKEKTYWNLLGIAIIMVVLQSYIQNTAAFSAIIGKTVQFFIPLIWAMFLSVLIYPLQCFLEEKLKMKKLGALLLSIFLLFMAVLTFVMTVIPQLGASIQELRGIYPYMVERIQDMSKDVILKMQQRGLLLWDGKEIFAMLSDYTQKNAQKIQDIGVSIFVNVFHLTMRVGNFLLGLFLACLVLANPKPFLDVIEDVIYLMVGREEQGTVVGIMKKARDIFINYFVGRLLVSFVVAVIVFLILFFSHTPYAVLTSVMFGVGNMIPYVGVWTASIVSAVLVLIFAPMKIGFLIFAIVVSQALDGFIIGPKIVGDKVGLSSFWVLVAILLCGKLMGITGMFLGVPIFSVIKLVYEERLQRARKRDASKQRKEEEIHEENI